jgi:hypothetical protein
MCVCLCVCIYVCIGRVYVCVCMYVCMYKVVQIYVKLPARYKAFAAGEENSCFLGHKAV